MDNPKAPRNLYSLDPEGRLCLHFHPGQARAWLSKRRHTLVLAGTQGGKTSFGPWWLYREIYGMGNLPGYHGMTGRGKGDYLAVTSSFDLFKLKMLPEIRTVFEDVLKVGRYWAGDRVLELINPGTGKFSVNGSSQTMWGRIILRSANAPSGLESATAKAAWLDEVGQDEWDVTAWEAILRRVSLNQGRTLGTTTVYNSGFLKAEIYDRWVNGDKNYNVIQFASVINPSFPQEEFETARERLPDWRFKMFYLGEFSQPAGLVYIDFKDDVHIVDPVPILDHWPIVIGLDFGGVHNCTIFIAENTDVSPSVYYAYAEYIDGHMPIKEIVNLTRERLGDRKRFTVVGGAGSEDVWRQEWGTAGMYVHRPPVGEVAVGILAVTALLRKNRFFVFRTCTGIRHEFNTYRYMVSADSVVSDIIMDKATFHRLDAIRYFAVTGTTPQLF